MRFLPAILAATCALAACNSRDAVAPEANDVDSLPTLNEVEANPTGAPPANATAAAPSPGIGAEIPSALLGRWGLTPADCTTTKSDAKGLLTVEPQKLTFYESRAVPSPGVQVSSDSVSGNFAFTGEGQEWTKYETLHVEGNKLVRTERDPMASFTYVRC
jgi:hypothetical protein